MKTKEQQRAYNTEWHRRWRANNPGASAKAKARYRAANLERVRRLAKAWWLKKSYGMTYEEYLARVEKQNGKCPLCRLVKKLVVDHNHATNEVRDLLCEDCNKGIGLLHENQQTLKRAIEYLDKWNGPSPEDVEG